MQRFLLWERRNNTVQPFGETVQQVFARISALRDSLDGPQVNLPFDMLHSLRDKTEISTFDTSSCSNILFSVPPSIWKARDLRSKPAAVFLWASSVECTWTSD